MQKVLVHTVEISDDVEKFDIAIPSNVKEIKSIAIRCVNEQETIPVQRTIAGLATFLLSGGHETIVSDTEVYFNEFTDCHYSNVFQKVNYPVQTNTFARIVFKHLRTTLAGADKVKVYLMY